MCGLSGFAGIKEKATRIALIRALGPRIDSRGRAGCGFVSLTEDGEVVVGRKHRGYAEADDNFVELNATGDMCLMHTRAPGHDGMPITDIHPFEVVRDDKTVMWGAHNGGFDNAWESARVRGRECTVDSQELFQLLADDQIEVLNNYNGWGVIEWVDTAKPREINLAKVCAYGELIAVELEQGGFVWASTPRILGLSLKECGLEVKEVIQFEEPGRVYVAREDGIFPTDKTGVQFSKAFG